MSLLFKEIFRKIKLSISRFLSIFLIVGLGVGFFAGIRGTSYDMLLTGDAYFDQTKLMDYKVISTYGFGTKEISELSKLKNVKTIVPSYSVDALDGSKVVRVHAIEDDVNKVVLKNGRMPKNEKECLAENNTYKVGDTIVLNSNDVDTKIKEVNLKVVGTVESSLYIGLEKGVTTIGNGKLESYIYILKDAFTMDVYTEVYLIGKGTANVNSYELVYDEQLDKLKEELTKKTELLEKEQYEDLLRNLIKQIDEAESEMLKQRSQGLLQLEQANNLLAASQKQISNAVVELDNKQKEFDQTIKENTAKLQLAWQQFGDKKKEYDVAYNDYVENKDKYFQELETSREQLALLKENVDSLRQQVDSCTSNCENLVLQLEELANKYDQAKIIFENREEELLNTPIVLEQTKNLLDENQQILLSQQENLEEKKIEGQKQIDASKKQLEIAQMELSKKYEEYYTNRNFFEQKMADAEKEIYRQREALHDIPKPTWYLMDRTDNANYSDFKNDALRVDAIAKVFPVFFLLVAALVCLNTMSRMVEEERTQIGIFKALGYSNFKIMFCYIFYVSIATLLGGIIGLMIGYQVLPRTIYGIYSFTYYLPDIIIYINPIHFTLIILIALILTNLVTMFSCYRELSEVPASLLRPKAPKAGKKVFLERINFIWKRIKFSGKVTIRNLFRYKKRIFMTVIGIAGCTALMLTGFGLKDSITDMIDIQFGNIFKYDDVLVLDKEIQTIDSNLDSLLIKNNLVDPLLIKQEMYSFKANSKNHDFYIFVASDADLLKKYISLRNSDTQKELSLSDDGVIITEKMAELLNLKIGDYVEARNSSNELILLKVSGVTENYIYHYAYMTPQYYEKVFNEDISYNAIMSNVTSSHHDEISTALIDSNRFVNVTFIADNMDKFNNMVDSLNKIVFVILIAACMLAFIVLYNLTNINIRERIREIATLKVLGFYDREVSNYVYREIFILTLIGIGCGLFLGVFLHKFVMITAEMDFIMFKRGINVSSYILATLVTILFSIIVLITTYFKLKKVDMIESLKSVE
ncbi:MAG: FtsX-like permease family protein [Bacilli bacterium]